jgi:hypothetical protein
MRACHLHTKEQAKNWDFDALAGFGAFRSMASDMLRYLKANMGVDGSPLTAAFVGSQCPMSALSGRWGIVQPVGSVAPSIDNTALGENTKRTDSANDGGLATSINGDAQRQ